MKSVKVDFEEDEMDGGGTAAARHGAALPAHDPRLFVSGVEKGLRVLRAFYNEPQALSLTQVAKLTGLGRSGAQRILYTLKTLGYLRHDPATRRYSLAPRVLDFGYAYLRNDGLIEQSFPYLLEASKRTDETVNLTELDGTEVIYVSRFPSRRVISVDIVLGVRLPVFCTAPGRAMLSQLAEPVAAGILDRCERVQRTPYTRTDRNEILALLPEIRRKGYALSNQETFVGDLSVASPVLNHRGEVLAAVNIAVPTPRWSIEQLENEFAPVVVETARAISKSLGRT